MTLTMTPADLLDLPVENDPMSPRSDQPKRRSFTAQYKRDVLVEYDAATAAGRGAILRRERLYSWHLTEWRKARDNGALAGLTTSAKSCTKATEKVEKAQWQARAERAERELARTKVALEIVGKAHALVEMLSESADTEPPSKR